MLIKEDFEIKNYTSFKIGGKIAKVYFPEKFEDMKNLPEKIAVIGNLSNTLVSSFGFSGAVFSTSKLDEIFTSPHPSPKLGEGAGVNELANFTPAGEVKHKTVIIAGAGVKGPKLAQTAAEYGLSGFEFMIGFPGSVGGEVFMNAGAHGQCIADVFKSAKIYDGENIKTLTKSEMEFSYRHSICQDKNYIVLEAEFELTPDNPEKIKQKMTENLEFRKAHQPSLVLPNCGSIFKNPENNSAGKLLDGCGVKDLQIGGAKVWENHANFIVNDGNATSTDVLQLMLEMQKRVNEKFGIELLPEIRYLGDNKDEVELCKKLRVL